MSLKIIFMGTPQFSIPTLNLILKNKHSINVIYSQIPKQSKRGLKVIDTPVIDFAKKNKLLFRCPEKLNNNEEFNFIKNLSADLAVVVAYGQLIPKKFLDLTKFGFINLHTSLLPKWRGAAPIQRAIMNGDKKTGVTIIKIQEKLDSGPIIDSSEINLNSESTFGDTEKKLSKIGANLIIKNLVKIEKKQTVLLEQNHSLASYAKKIKKEECKIDWNLDAEKILNRINGLSPVPGAWFEHKNKRYKILKAKLVYSKGEPGRIINDNLTVACKSNSISIIEIQREGKKRQNIKEFLLGNFLKIGTSLI